MASIKKRENKKGTSYIAVVRKKGFETVSKTFLKKSHAQDWARDVETRMQNGDYRKPVYTFEVDGQKIVIETVKDLILFFKDNIAPQRYVDTFRYTYMYNWWIDKIGNIKIIELSASHITSCKTILMNQKFLKGKKKVNYSNNTINKYIMCLSAVLAYAVSDLELINVNPISKITLMAKPNGRTRFLSAEEITQLLNACKEHSDMLYLFFILSLSTGARYSEILNLTLTNIDFENHQLFFLDTKNKEHRGVPISPDILKILKLYIEKNEISDKIFINKKTGKLFYVRLFLQKVIKKIGLKDFHIHDIRHTTASYIAMNGGSLLDIAEILGHKSLVMARRYSHLTQKHTAGVLKRVTNKLIPDV